MIDAKSDLTERDLRIMKRSKGTNILVSNSLIKPEIFRFSTKISDAIVEVFDEMKDPQRDKKAQFLDADNFQSLTYAGQMEMEEEMARNYYSQDDYQDMQERIRTVDDSPNHSLERDGTKPKNFPKNFNVISDHQLTFRDVRTSEEKERPSAAILIKDSQQSRLDTAHKKQESMIDSYVHSQGNMSVAEFQHSTA